MHTWYKFVMPMIEMYNVSLVARVAQTPNMKWEPSPQVSDLEGSDPAYRGHMLEQGEVYKRNVCINLIDQKGGQGRMEKAFTAIVRVTRGRSVSYNVVVVLGLCTAMRFVNILF
jgi:hypothetical protein